MFSFRNRNYWGGILLLLTTLSGCRILHTPAPTPGLPVPVSYIGSTDSTNIAYQPYRNLFKDPNLTALIDTALDRNPDLRIALQRIEITRANYFIRQGQLLPTVNGVASAGADRFGAYTMNGVGNFDSNLSENVKGRRQIPNPTPDLFLGFRASWELDIWGKIRNRQRAAFNRVLASQEGRNMVVTNLIADIARLYYTLLALDAELETIRENIELQQQALELVQIQKDAGRVTELAVQQFRAQLLDTRSREGGMRQQIVEAENALNVLMGRYPQPIPRGRSLEELVSPSSALAGIPAQLVRRRPDVRQAERELEAANVDVAVAQAEFLPSLTLTPYVGLNAFRASVLLNPASAALGVLGQLATPVFNRRQLKGNLAISEAQSREALFAYQRAVLNGVSEVVNSLRGLENYRNVATIQTEEVAVLKQSTAISNTLFGTGYATYLEVITAQRSVLEAELSLVNTKRMQFMALVDLYRALGGGWQ